MTAHTLSHSDQIVTLIAKLPPSAFGSRCTRDVALAIAKHMNKTHGLSAPVPADYRQSCRMHHQTTRTVRNALCRREALGFTVTTHRQHEHVSDWNLASVYRLGDKLRSFFKQSFRPSSKKVPRKVSPSLNTDKSNKKGARPTGSVGKYSLYDQERATLTPEEWEAYTKRT